MGIDLAYTRDLSAIALVFPPVPADACWRVVMRFFLPEEGLKLRALRDFVPYDDWARAGFIQVTPGNVTDFDAIGNAAEALAVKFNPDEIAFDRMFAGATVNRLMACGLNCVGVGQGFYSMALPCAELERAVLGRCFRHGDNPVLTWNASNVVVTRDERGNMKPDHKKAGERIDGMQALLTAMARACSPDAQERSPYSADRGLLVL
jgi:phage terminase large subunit-like protein